MPQAGHHRPDDAEKAQAAGSLGKKCEEIAKVLRDPIRGANTVARQAAPGANNGTCANFRAKAGLAML